MERKVRRLNMGFLDNITGKATTDKVDVFAARMEDVYAAMATRMVEILDKEERLRQTQAQLDEALRWVNPTAWESRFRRLTWALISMGAMTVVSLAVAIWR
jgi:hypothetical protein